MRKVDDEIDRTEEAVNNMLNEATLCDCLEATVFRFARLIEMGQPVERAALLATDSFEH